MTINLFLKSIDRVFGHFLCDMIFRPKNEIPVKKNRILIIRPGGIGDAVLLASSVRCLKKIHPHIRITILAEQRNAGVLSLISGIDNVLSYDIPHEFIQALRGRYYVVIDTEQWYRLSAVVARLIRAPVKIGFDTNERRRMFTQCIQYDSGAYEPDNFLALLKPLGIDCQHDPGAVTLSVPPQSVSTANQSLQPLGSELFIVIFPGASIPEKRWGVEHFRQAAEMLSAFGVKIVVVGGKDDRPQGEVIAGGGLGLNLAGLTSLSETAAVIQKSALLVSGDSGVLHIAAGLGIPTVSLFGPGMAKKWAPRGDRHVVINTGLPCSPCSKFGTTPPCPIGARCMQDITVDEVVNAVTTMLTSVGAMPPSGCRRDWIEAE